MRLLGQLLGYKRYFTACKLLSINDLRLVDPEGVEGL